MVSQVNFIKHREELTPILLKLLRKITEIGKLPSSFYKDTISLIPKPDKDITKKTKLQTNIIDECIHKNHQQNTISNGIQQHMKRIIHHD